MLPIEEFVAHVLSSPAVQLRLGPVGNDPDAIAAFARAEGFDVEGEACAEFIDAQLEARLTPAQKLERAACLERVSRGVRTSHEGTLPAPSVTTVDGNGAVTIHRRAVFNGQLAIIERLPATAALVAHLRTMLTSAFGGIDPRYAFQTLDADAYFACVRASDDALAHHDAIPGLVASLARALGFPAPVNYFGPYVRHNLPAAKDDDTVGYFAGVPVRAVSRDDARAGSPLINAHRDTWFGAPFHQVNLWAPLYDYPAGAGLAIVQDYFARPLRNNTAGFDVWRAKLGLAVGPMCLEEVDWSTRFDVDLPAGDLVCFSANHFHGTGLNLGDRSRISFELRFACDEDRVAGHAAPNVDFGGVGELDGFRRT
jgi:hypothetical protein